MPTSQQLAEIASTIRKFNQQERLTPAAAAYRQAKIEETPRVTERVLQKAASSAVVGLYPGEQLDPDTVAREAAKLYSRYPQELPGLLKESEAPVKVVQAAKEAVTGEKTTPWYMRALNWTVKQVERPWSAYKAFARRMPEDEGLERTPINWLRTRPQALKEATGAFIHPEQGPEYLIEPKEFESKGVSPKWAKRLSGAIEFAGGMALDPTSYLGIGPASKLVRGGAEAAEAALKTTRRLASVEGDLAKAERLVATRGDEVKNLSAELRSITKDADKAGKQLPKAQQKLADTVAKLESHRQTMAQATKTAAQIRRDAALSPTRKLKKMAARSGEELAQKPPLTPAQASKLGDKIRALEGKHTAQLAHIDELQGKILKLAEVSQTHRAAVGAHRGAEGLVSTLRGERGRLQELLKPEYLLTFGVHGSKVPLVSVEPIIKTLREGFRGTMMNAPKSVKNVTDFLAGTFRATAPRYGQVADIAEHRKLGDVMPRLHESLQKAVSKGAMAGEETLKQWAGRRMPEEARKLVPYAIEARDRAAFLAKIPPEFRPMVENAAHVYEESMDQAAQRLQQAFGLQFMSVLDNYVSHIYKDAPEKVKESISQYRKATKGRLAGSRFPFAKQRVFPTLEAAKEFGLHPIEDAAVLEAVYRASSEKLLGLKSTTDWLTSEGFIKPLSAAPAGWEKAADFAPWLQGAAIHPETARVFKALKPALELNSKELGTIDRAYRASMGIFKGLVTSIRPGFHAVNVLGNMVLMRMGGIPYSKIPELLTNATKELANPGDTYRMFRELGLEGQGMFADVGSVKKLLPRLEEQWKNMTGSPLGRIARAVSSPLATGRKVGELEDSVFRLGAFQHFLQQGIAPEEAARLVKRYLFDYSQLTQAERAARQYLVPFYSWARYAIPRSILGAIEQPGALTGFSRLQQTLAKVSEVDQADLPEYLQSALVLGKTDDDKVTYINPQPPWQTLLAYTGGEEPGAAGRELANALAPQIKGGMMFLTGRNVMTGKPVVEGQLEENPALARLAAVIKQFVPWWEVETAFPQLQERPKLVGRLLPGAAGIATSPLSMFDTQLDKAYGMGRLEDLVDEFQQQQRDKGLEVPGSGPVTGAAEEIEQEESAVRLMDELQTNAWKQDVITKIASSVKGLGKLSPQEQSFWVFQNVILPYSTFFSGSNEDVYQRLQSLYTAENYRAVQFGTGTKNPSLMDFLTHMEALESGELGDTTPEMRRFQRSVSLAQRFRETQQDLQASGGW